MLQSLPSCMTKMKDLQLINVSNNPLRKLPVELGELPSLHYINLQGCKMDFPPAEVSESYQHNFCHGPIVLSVTTHLFFVRV